MTDENLNNELMKKLSGFVVFLLLILFFTSCEEEKTNFRFNRRLIIVPVTIEGRSYSFLFDTGGGTSTITGRLAAEHGLKSKPSKITTYDISEGRKRTVMLTDPVSIKIGGKSVTTQFDVSGTYQNAVYDGIIGMDIIGKFNWLFDFEEKTLSISDGFLIPVLSNSWTRQASYGYTKSFSVPFISLKINGSRKQSFYFDTGMYDGYYDDASQKYLYYSFVFNEPEKSAMTRFKRIMSPGDKISYHISARENYNVLYFMDNTINGTRHAPLASAIYKNRDSKYKVLKERKLTNIVTVNYLHHYDGMYIDTKFNRISFYNKNGKSGRDKGENVQWFYDKHFGGFSESY